MSLSKWEARWEKPFLDNVPKTREQRLDYVRCMTITPNVDPAAYYGLTAENMEEINRYIDASMTATWFSGKEPRTPTGNVVTAEIIYYWMIALNIPFECQKWHLNRLMTLIRVCNIKNTPPKKSKNRRTDFSQRAAINRARKERMRSNG